MPEKLYLNQFLKRFKRKKSNLKGKTSFEANTANTEIASKQWILNVQIGFLFRKSGKNHEKILSLVLCKLKSR
jgi:hypothetical protein